MTFAQWRRCHFPWWRWRTSFSHGVVGCCTGGGGVRASFFAREDFAPGVAGVLRLLRTRPQAPHHHYHHNVMLEVSQLGATHLRRSTCSTRHSAHRAHTAQQLLHASVYVNVLICAYLRVRHCPAATVGAFCVGGHSRKTLRGFTFHAVHLCRSTCCTCHGPLSSAPTAQHVADASLRSI